MPLPEAHPALARLHGGTHLSGLNRRKLARRPLRPSAVVLAPRGRLLHITPIHPLLNLTEEPKMAGMRSGLVILKALLLSGSVAVAQQAGKPCAGDIKTLCAGIQPGEGRIKACIKSHLTDLSPTCEDRLLTVAVTEKVCKTDVTNLCAGIVPRHRRYQSLHKIAHGRGERSLQGCDVPGRGGQENLGTRGSLEIIVRERGHCRKSKPALMAV